MGFGNLIGGKAIVKENNRGNLTEVTGIESR
jgi:hypothetical protein